jgi:hypothetical protein
MRRSARRRILEVAFGLLLGSLLGATGTWARTIEAESARRSAAAEFVFHALRPSFVTDGWRSATLGQPVTIFDPNGTPLYYEIGVYEGERVLGAVTAAADDSLGTDVIAFRRGARARSLDKAAAEAAALTAREKGHVEIRRVWPVAYRGQTVGIAVAFLDTASRREGVSTFDVETMARVTPEDIRSTLWDIPGDENSLRIKCYDRDRLWSVEVESILDHAGVRLRKLEVAPLDAREWAIAEQMLVAAGTPTWTTVDLSRCKLYKQTTATFCARATLQMFNYFWLGSSLHTQNQIDAALIGYGWNSDWKAAFKLYLAYSTKLWTSKSIDKGQKAYDTMWTEMCQEIDADRPFAIHEVYASKNTAHIMFAMGYLEEDKDVFGMLFTQEWVGIYDPAGSVYEQKLFNDSVLSYAQFAGYITAAP